MPLVYDPTGRSNNILQIKSKNLSEANYGYRYPKGINLKPGSETHNRIISMVNQRVLDSYRHMSTRHKTWKAIDKNLTAYVALDDKEKAVKDYDSRRPVRVIVPQSYATLETLLAYWVTAYLDNPIFRYEGRGPEDEVGSILMELAIAYQTQMAKMGLSLYYQARDAYTYGFGASHPRWIRKTGYRRVEEEQGFFSQLFQGWRKVGNMKKRVPALLYEGNELMNIDPYCYLPDPGAPIDNPQAGAFVGWVRRTNVMTLLSEEQNSDTHFNAQYLQHVDARSSLVERLDMSGREARFGTTTGIDYTTTSVPADVVYMYINIIPRDMGLGSSPYPEKWYFEIGGDCVVLAAAPENLDHCMFPVGVISPSADGYSTAPVSKLEVVSGLQEVLDFLYTSHIKNVRKAINDVLIVDPKLVNMKDLKDNDGGWLVRLRRSAWGRGIDNAVQQLKVTDITAQHLSEAPLLIDFINRMTGTVDALQGVQRRSGERVSATEASDTRQGALSRLMKDGRICSLQGMQDLGYMLASHTQQLMSEELYVKVVGEWEARLRTEFNLPPGVNRYPVNPMDLLVGFDVVMKDGTIPDSSTAKDWIQLYGMITAQQELIGTYDVPRIFMHIARMLGAKNVHEFIRQGQVQPQVMPDQAVQDQAAAGNIIPIGGAA